MTPWVRTSRAPAGEPGHGATPTTERPSVSGQPSARFIDCTAAPPVPLTRLSIARIATNVSASSSTATRDVSGVAADDRAGARQLALGQQVNERLRVVGLFVCGPQLRQRRPGARGAGGQDAARHRDEHRGERHRDVAVGDGLQALRDLRGVPVGAGDVVGARRPDDLRAEQVGLGGATGARGAADGDHRDGGLDEVLGDRGQQRQQRRGRIAARHRDRRGAAQPLPCAGQLGQPVGPAAGVRRAVELLPRGRVGEPEVRAAVDDQGVGAELFGQRGRMAVRQAQEHHVMAGQHAERRWPPARAGPTAAGADGARASVVPALAAAVSAPIVSRPSA